MKYPGFVLVIFLFLSSCNDVPIVDGKFSCSPTDIEGCPPGYICLAHGIGGDYRCWSSSDSYCGNGQLDEGELCDKSEFSPSVSCESGVPYCVSTCNYICSVCGNNLLEQNSAGEGEECDDGNTSDGDGCSSECFIELPYCVWADYVKNRDRCAAHCGDGIKNGPEMCDYGDLGAYSCAVAGYYHGIASCKIGCSEINTSECTGFCGDGVVSDFEQCDGTAQDEGFDCTHLHNGAGGSIKCDSDCKVVTDACFFNGWHQETSDATESLKSIWGTGDSWYAVGESGTVIHYLHGSGNIHEHLSSPVSNMLWDVWGANPEKIFACGTHTIIECSSGICSEMTGFDSSETYSSIWGRDENDIFVVTLTGKIMHYNGTTWSLFSDTGVSSLYAVWGNEHSLYVAGASGSLRRYDNFNLPFTNIDTPTVDSIAGLSGDGTTLYAVGSNGLMLSIDDLTVTQIDTSGVAADEMLWSVWEDSTGVVYVAGNGGTLLRYEDNILSREQISSSTHFHGVYGNADGNVKAVGEDGAIWSYTNDGWNPVDVTSAMQIKDLWGTTAQNLLAVDVSGNLNQLQNGNWVNVPLPGTPVINGIHGNSVGKIVAAGDNGAVFLYDGVWNKVDDPILDIAGLDLNCVWVTENGEIFIGEDWGTVLHYNGTIWFRLVDQTQYMTINSIWSYDKNNMFAVGDDGVILHYDGLFLSEMTGITSEKLNGVFGTDPYNVFAVGSNGTIIHWNGLSWQKIDIGETTNLNSIWGDRYNNMFIAGDDGLILHWDGIQWSKMSSESGNNIYSVWGVESHKVFIGGYGLFMEFDDQAFKQDNAGSCQDVTTIYCNSVSWGNSVEGTSNIDLYQGCQAYNATGNETVYKFDSPVTGHVRVKLTLPLNSLQFLVLESDSDGGCDLNSCVADYTVATSTELSIPVVVGKSYFFVIEGDGATDTPFEISVECSEPLELN